MRFSISAMMLTALILLLTTDVATATSTPTALSAPDASPISTNDEETSARSTFLKTARLQLEALYHANFEQPTTITGHTYRHDLQACFNTTRMETATALAGELLWKTALDLMELESAVRWCEIHRLYLQDTICSSQDSYIAPSYFQRYAETCLESTDILNQKLPSDVLSLTNAFTDLSEAKFEDWTLQLHAARHFGLPVSRAVASEGLSKALDLLVQSVADVLLDLDWMLLGEYVRMAEVESKDVMANLGPGKRTPDTWVATKQRFAYLCDKKTEDTGEDGGKGVASAASPSKGEL